MNGEPYSQADVLLIKASEDEAALRATGNPDVVLCFHAQQALEKLFKALISSHGVLFEKTHDLLRLVKALADLGEVPPVTLVSLSELNDFAVEYRYDLLFQHESPNVVELLETVRLIREFVMNRIAALAQSPLSPPV